MERYIKINGRHGARRAFSTLLLAASTLLCACSSGEGGTYAVNKSEAVQEGETEQTKIVTPDMPSESEPSRNAYASDVQTVRIVAAGDSMCHEAVLRVCLRPSGVYAAAARFRSRSIPTAPTSKT